MEPKEQILNAAIELFSKKSFEGVSLREIANQAGVHFASIRYHFGDKDELYKTCLSQHGEGRLESARRYLTDGPTSIDDLKLRLSFALEEVLRVHGENPHLTKLLLMEVESGSSRSDQILRKTMLAMSETYAQFFKRGQMKGFISKDQDPLFLAQSLMGVLHHFMRTENIRQRLLSHKTFKNKEARDALVANILKLYLPQE